MYSKIGVRRFILIIHFFIIPL